MNSPSCKNENSNIHSNYDIEFLQELSNDSIIFKIINTENEHAGHAVLTLEGNISIIEKCFFEFSDEDKNYLESRVKLFSNAINYG